jgi:RNA polymerase sigma-70 factor (ECF subfamily)
MRKTAPDTSLVSHEILMVRFQRRLDIKAFQRIVSEFSAPALAVAQRILSDAILAEDAVQETFLRVFRRRDQFKPTRPFSCWFYAILRNVCRDLLRQRLRHMQAMSQMAEWPAAPDRNPGGHLDVQEALDTLPVSEQTVLTFRIVHGLPFCDIAALMGISHEAAKKRAQRGLRRLRQRMLGHATTDSKSCKTPVPAPGPRS